MGNRGNNVILTKSMDFAVKIIRLSRILFAQHDYEWGNQIIRCGTSIGANLREANEGYSRKEFESKIYISLKEARETEFWLELLWRSEVIEEFMFNDIRRDCDEILKILVSITKTLRNTNT